MIEEMLDDAYHMEIENVITREGYMKQVFLNTVRWIPTDKIDAGTEKEGFFIISEDDSSGHRGYYHGRTLVHQMHLEWKGAMQDKENLYKIWTGDEVAFVDTGYNGRVDDSLRKRIIRWHEERLNGPERKEYNFLHNPKYLKKIGNRFKEIGHDIAAGYLFIPRKRLLTL